MFSFDESKVNLKKRIGSGSYGTVYAYQKNPDDKDWVVKVMGTKKTEEFLLHIQEIVFGFNLDHPNVIPIKGFHIEFDDKGGVWNTYIKLPRMQGSLSEKIESYQLKKETIPEDQLARYLYDLVCGLEYLHEKKIAHRDIKPGNILIDKDGKLRIADFGIGNFVGDESSKTLKEEIGTKRYIAPEIIKGGLKLKKKDLFKADLWSLGLVMLELSLPETKFKKDINEFEADFAEKLKEKGYSDILIDFISGLLQINPLDRKSIWEVKQTLEQIYLFKYSGEWKEKIKASNTRIIMIINPEKIVRKELKKTNGEFFTFKKYVYREDIGIKIQPKDCSRIKNDQIKSMIHEFTEKLNECNYWKEFKALSLNLQEITDDAVKDLAKEIGSKLTNLKYLSLGAQNCKKITDKGIQAWADHIGTNLTSLELLFLYFSNCPNLTDAGAQELIRKAASGCKDLKILGFDFGRCNISDPTVNQLTEALPTSFKDLKELYIYLPDCLKVTEKAISELINGVANNLKSIEKLDLGLVGCNVSDDTIRQLSKCSDFKNLKSLALYFDQCTQINNDPLYELIEKISSMENLQALDLSLENCTQINQKTVQFICSTIPNKLKSLQILGLFFNNLNVDKVIQKELTDSLEHIPDLRIRFEDVIEAS